MRTSDVTLGWLASVASAFVLTMAAGSAGAVTVGDPAGDFLPTYAGPQNGDLDVTGITVELTGSDTVRLIGEHAAAIGTTEGSSYVWGVDRGQGQEFLTFVDPPVGQGVTFDAVVALFADGTGFVLDLLAGTPPTNLDPSAIDIEAGRISVTVSESLLPSTGFAFERYRYNLWPRYAPDGVDPEDNTQISDFAPNASTIAPVPVPATLGLQLLGLGLLGAMVRDRQRRRST